MKHNYNNPNLHEPVSGTYTDKYEFVVKKLVVATELGQRIGDNKKEEMKFKTKGGNNA